MVGRRIGRTSRTARAGGDSGRAAPSVCAAGASQQAYEDMPLPIGQGQTISQPYIVALMTQALRLTPASRVLEIGTGSGYQAAILARITPHVWSIETLPDLAEAARARLHGLGYEVEVQVGRRPAGLAGAGALRWHHRHRRGDRRAARAGCTTGRKRPAGHPGREEPMGSKPLADRAAAGRLRRELLAEVRFVPLVATTLATEPDDPALADVRRELSMLFEPRSDSGCA